MVLVGPNGSGKTSLFEAFNYWASQVKGINFDEAYHPKMGATPTANWSVMMQRIQLTFHDLADDPRNDPTRRRKLFYLRSAYRHEADFTLSTLQRGEEILADANRPTSLINVETRVSDNYRRIVHQASNPSMTRHRRRRLLRKLQTHLLGAFELEYVAFLRIWRS